jgi:Holliday junction resolvase RusA-like endonuclease
MITLELPYPPSLNHFKKIGRTMRTKKGFMYQTRVNSPQTELFYQQVWVKVKASGIKSFGAAKLVLEIDVHAPDKRRRDLDNVCKVSIDSLQRAGLFDDDFNIDRLLIERKSIISGGLLVVRLSTMKVKE